MKRMFTAAIAALVALLWVGCSRQNIIPDSVLAQIFHDAFLTNAYLDEHRSIRVDSLRIYEPVFEKYGYTTEDVMNTIGNFSRRKSARLGDVVERAIVLLEQEGEVFNREVAVLDTINNVARRTFTHTVLSDSLIRFRRWRDTTLTNFTLPVRPGRYTVAYDYQVGEDDANEYRLRYEMWLERGESTFKSNLVYNTLNRYSGSGVKREFRVDSTFSRLQLRLVTVREKPKQPSVTIRNLVVKYIPDTEAAVDSLYRRQLDIRIFSDSFISAACAARNGE